MAGSGVSGGVTVVSSSAWQNARIPMRISLSAQLHPSGSSQRIRRGLTPDEVTALQTEE